MLVLRNTQFSIWEEKPSINFFTDELNEEMEEVIKGVT